MGMSSSVYLGAYLLVPNTPRTVVKPVKYCSAHCGSAHCVRVAGALVCQGCGAAVICEDRPVTINTPLRMEELGLEDSDQLWSPESGRDKQYTLWLPNHLGVGRVFSEDTQLSPSELPALDAQALEAFKEKFLDRYAPVVDAITAQLGVAPCVQVGVVPYWN